MELVERSLDDSSTYIVDVEVKGSAGKPVVSVYLDTDQGGIDLDACAAISRRLQVLIEANQLFGSTYTLNVSSPGLDRPLKSARQYASNKGRKAKIRYSVDGKPQVIEGTIRETDENGVEIEHDKQRSKIDFSSIIETKIQPVF